jgi:hypothetical protein
MQQSIKLNIVIYYVVGNHRGEEDEGSGTVTFRSDLQPSIDIPLPRFFLLSRHQDKLKQSRTNRSIFFYIASRYRFTGLFHLLTWT